jgi:hypothetical protein
MGFSSSSLRVRTWVLAGAAWGAWGACAPAAELPLVAGNFNIAQEFLHGDTHALLFGDSLQNYIISVYPQVWKIDRWAGQVGGPNLSASPLGPSGTYAYNTESAPFVQSQGFYLASDTPPDGIRSTGPGTSSHVVFKAATGGPDNGLYSNVIAEVSLAEHQETTYRSGKWADKSTGTITADLLLYANPKGVSSGVQFDVYINDLAKPVASIPINTRSATPGLIKQTISFPAEAWQPYMSIHGAFRVTPGAQVEEGSNLIYDGVRYSTGQPGFQLANVARGGAGIDYFLSTANCDDATLKKYVDATDTNTCMIWLGENDYATISAPAFKGRMLSLISRYRAARPDMKFILIPTYDTGSPVLADYAERMYEIAQSDPSVLFLNLYKAAGDFAFLDANYLEDHVHQNTAGEYYMANKTQELLDLAAARAPEPGTMTVLAMAGMFAGLRRRQRR